MDKNLENLIEELEEKVDEYHYQGVCYQGTSDTLSEFYYGYSEGITFTIEKLKELFKQN